MRIDLAFWLVPGGVVMWLRGRGAELHARARIDAVAPGPVAALLVTHAARALA